MHYQGSETVHNMGGTGRVTCDEAGYSSARWIAIQELERRKEARSS